MFKAILGWLCGSRKHGRVKLKPGQGIWWSCSSQEWSPRILEALEHSQSSTVKMAFDSAIAWEEDVFPILHHVAVWIADQALELENNARPAPPYFRATIVAKRKWLAGEIDENQYLGVCEDLLCRTRSLWPSSFCTGVNATYAIHHCFARCMMPDAIHQMLYQGAHFAALHAASLASCRALKCDLSDVTLVEEEKKGKSVVRGVDCPGVDGDSAVRVKAFNDARRAAEDVHERCLTNVLLLRMSGKIVTDFTDPLAIGDDQWQRIADEVGVQRPLVARAVKAIHSVQERKPTGICLRQ